MATLKFDTATLDASLGVLSDSFNKKVLDSFTPLARALKEEAENGVNALVDKALANCKKVQDIYNPCVDSYKGFFTDMREVNEIAEYLDKKAELGEIGTHDASFKNEGIDSSEVVI